MDMNILDPLNPTHVVRTNNIALHVPKDVVPTNESYTLVKDMINSGKAMMLTHEVNGNHQFHVIHITDDIASGVWKHILTTSSRAIALRHWHMALNESTFISENVDLIRYEWVDPFVGSTQKLVMIGGTNYGVSFMSLSSWNHCEMVEDDIYQASAIYSDLVGDVVKATNIVRLAEQNTAGTLVGYLQALFNKVFEPQVQHG